MDEVTSDMDLKTTDSIVTITMIGITVLELVEKKNIKGKQKSSQLIIF